MYKDLKGKYKDKSELIAIAGLIRNPDWIKHVKSDVFEDKFEDESVSFEEVAARAAVFIYVVVKCIDTGLWAIDENINNGYPYASMENLKVG